MGHNRRIHHRFLFWSRTAAMRRVETMVVMMRSGDQVMMLQHQVFHRHRTVQMSSRHNEVSHDTATGREGEYLL